MPKTSAHRAALPAPAHQALQDLGAAIRQARLRRALTIEDLAQRCDVGPQTISRLEKGDPGVAIGTVAAALCVMGLSQELGAVARRDPDGEALDRVRGRQRARRRQAPDIGF